MKRIRFFLVSVLMIFAISQTIFFAGDITRLLPASNDVTGWVRKNEPRIFEHSKLWEYIDGGADVYIEYGFQQVSTVELVNDNGSIIVDIYEMKTPEGAFGMYARERAPTYHYINVGADGYHEGVALIFYQANFYIKLTAFTDDAQTKDALPKIARLVSRKIGSNRKQPALLLFFPEQGKEKHTETFEMKKYLGQTALRETYTMRFHIQGKKFTAFLCSTASPAAAAMRMQSLRASLMSVGSSDRFVEGLGDAILTGKHREAQEIVFVRKGKYIAGLFPSSDQYITKTFLRTLLGRLK